MRQKILAAVFIGAFTIFSPVQAMDQKQLSSEEEELGFDLPWMTIALLANVGIFFGETYAEELGGFTSSLPSIDIGDITDEIYHAIIFTVLEL